MTLTIKGFGKRLERNLSGLVRRITAGRELRECEGGGWAGIAPEMENHPHVLAITADLSFYSCVLSAASSCGWSAEWARSMSRGLEICGLRSAPIVIYDRNLPNVDWRRGLERLTKTASHARVLLAAPRVDEDLWKTVLGRRGYDVVIRTATSDQLKRELRFAWLSLQQPAWKEQEETETPVLSGR